MSKQTTAGITSIAVPILFNAGFTLLADRFDAWSIWLLAVGVALIV